VSDLLIQLGLRKGERSRAPSSRRPPSFEEAKNRRQKVRMAGMNPDYWYPAEWDHGLAPGKVVEVRFWGRSIALFRDEQGALHAIEDRCAHRQLKLSQGQVKGCQLTCMYHGWEYDGDGRLAHVPHDLFGSKMPKAKLVSFPVQVRHGIIWIFPGDPALVDAHPVPEIPELAADSGWGVLPVDFVVGCHHSMVIDNVSDFTHAYLHRSSRPFTDARLTRLDPQGDTVHLSYETKVGTGKISGLFVDRSATNTNAMELAYEYPYQRSSTDGKIKHWLFVLPMDERTTRTFYVFYFSPDTLKVPFLPISLRGRTLRTVMRAARVLLVRPLLTEDKVAVELEQEGYEEHFDKPIAELNPAVREFQDLTIRKWEEHLQKTARPTSGTATTRAEPAAAPGFDAE
jgi:phenylpropionate dioxygenase-like ring-hydroxylating dioxygenase large terminal subunit